jgi:hypothetical protein
MEINSQNHHIFSCSTRNKNILAQQFKTIRVRAHFKNKSRRFVSPVQRKEYCTCRSTDGPAGHPPHGPTPRDSAAALSPAWMN